MGDASLPSLPKLPSPQLTSLGEGICQLLPLSRRGTGPGLIILTPSNTSNEEDTIIKNGIPSPLIKWAEESYTVIQIQSTALAHGSDALQTAIDALAASPTVEDRGRYAVVAYDADMFQRLDAQLSKTSEIVGAIIYTDLSTSPIITTLPSIQHIAGKPASTLPRTRHLTAHAYPTAQSPNFALPTSPDFNYSLEAISHTRNLTFLKHHTMLSSPTFDLEAIWDEHTYYEFETRDVAATMATMVQEPYVNHIPTLTGGIGRASLTDFYTHHFIFANPDDAELELISRTVGIDRVVDEFIYKFTHDCVVDWLLPGLPPTGRKLEIPMMAVVNIRGDRLYHEHITWDQATALRQVGVLPEYLPWPTPTTPTTTGKLGRTGSESLAVGSGGSGGIDGLLDDSVSGTGELMARLPVAGIDTARKLRDKNAVESNRMFGWKMSCI